ncbi:hypothetical protein ASF56_21660 [Methylobacterium sp. Leaf122]|nr:hypothetical protein ASF56_21660 [Methylobacterium sp. Leaf122]
MILAAGFTLLLAAPRAWSDDPSNDLFRAGLKFLSSDDYKSACDMFERGLAVSKNSSANGKASYYYGECLLKLNKPQQALAAYKRATELNLDSDQGRNARLQVQKLEATLAANRNVGPAPDRRAVKAFNWIYNFQPSPGLRSWSIDDTGRWRERYPDGQVAKVFDVRRRSSANDCPGAIVSSTSEPDFEVFIPDLGCSKMIALFRRGAGSWNNMAQMIDVR